MQTTKQRHGCLTAWLIFMIVMNALASLAYLFGGSLIAETTPGLPGWAIWGFAFFSILNVIFAIALFTWKKWGFWGFCASSGVVFFLNIFSGINILSAVFGLIGIAILYGVLQIGNENKGWAQLE